MISEATWLRYYSAAKIRIFLYVFFDEWIGSHPFGETSWWKQTFNIVHSCPCCRWKGRQPWQIITFPLSLAATPHWSCRTPSSGHQWAVARSDDRCGSSWSCGHRDGRVRRGDRHLSASWSQSNRCRHPVPESVREAEGKPKGGKKSRDISS